MTLKDYRSYELSGATASARDDFERALACFQSWRNGAETHIERALTAAPCFTMAHVLSAYLCLCSRDVVRVRKASQALARATTLSSNARERLHIAAIGAALSDDLATVKALLDTLLQQFPRDVLALQVGHVLDYITGDSEHMSARVSAVLPVWSKALPGYHAVLAMRAFALVENADYQSAADTALQALEFEPFDARAHHALAHVYEMAGDAAGGVTWMQQRIGFWSNDTTVATHCWWHWALFHLSQGKPADALALYDQRIRADRSSTVADMIDASALLWRIDLLGASAGARWHELASAWARHINDGFCTFNDLHAMLAFVGAEDWPHATQLECELLRRQHFANRHGETTRLIGLPACRGIIAFGRGDYARAIEMLSALPAFARHIGGSQAQRDVLYLTLLESVQRIRRAPLRKAA